VYIKLLAKSTYIYIAGIQQFHTKSAQVHYGPRN